MSYLQNLPIKRKILLLTLSTSGCTLLLTAAAMWGSLVYIIRPTFVRMETDRVVQLESKVATLIASPTSNALGDFWEVVSRNPNRHYVGLQLPDGRMLVQNGEDNRASFPEKIKEGGTLQVGSDVYFVEPLFLDSKRIGTLYAYANNGMIEREILHLFGVVLGVVGVGSLFASVAVWRQGHKWITRPVLTLVATAKIIAEKKDYSVRAPQGSGDEIGYFTNAFNQMLAEIQQRDLALETAQKKLASQLEALQHEVRERERAEAELEQTHKAMAESQKLESLGIMAGGIAHDFNNLLTVILGSANLVRLSLAEDHASQNDLENIEKASLRAADLCKQMITCAGKSILSMSELSLNRMVTEATERAKHAITPKATLHLELGEPLPLIVADGTIMGQVLMNLLQNAAEAIEEAHRPGAISITTGIAKPSRTELNQMLLGPELPTGEYVFLEIRDDGCGIQEKDKPHVFDPFYSTKFTGRGLGLSAVLGIVKGHRGALRLDSALDKGTRIRLLFPQPVEIPSKSMHVAEEKESWRGGGLILIADDEDGVRGVASKFAQSFGFQTILAADGPQTMEAFRKHSSQIVAVLLDLTLPDVEGKSTFHEIRKLQPAVPILLMSGHSEGEAKRQIGEGNFSYFIQKPFLRGALGQKLQECLGEKTNTTAASETNPAG